MRVRITAAAAALALLLSPITAHAEEADEPAGQAAASFSSTEEDSPAQAFVTAITLTAGSTAIAAVAATLVKHFTGYLAQP